MKRQELRRLERTIRDLHDQKTVTGHDPPEKAYVEKLYGELQDRYKIATGHFYSWSVKKG